MVWSSKTIEVECQTPGCNNKVVIIANHPYFGILCDKCSKPNLVNSKNE